MKGKGIIDELDEVKAKFLIDVKEVLLSCLQDDPKDRCSAEELLKYNLFTKI